MAEKPCVKCAGGMKSIVAERAGEAMFAGGCVRCGRTVHCVGPRVVPRYA